MSTTSSHPISELQELQMVEENPNAATNYYAGPFCGCGDYSCPASDNPHARCVNQEYPGNYLCFDAEGNTIVVRATFPLPHRC